MPRHGSEEFTVSYHVTFGSRRNGAGAPVIYNFGGAAFKGSALGGVVSEVRRQVCQQRRRNRQEKRRAGIREKGRSGR